MLMLLIMPFVVFENVEAKEVVVHQDFSSGELTVWTQPGLKWKGWGQTTSYPKSAEFKFLAQKDDKGEITSTRDCVQTRFNDKGKAAICGQVSFDLPTDPDKMEEVHSKYNHIQSIRDRIIKATMTKAVYHSGPLMSSKESAGERRGDLVSYLQDQAVLGIYDTEEREEEVEDLTAPPVETVEMVDTPALDEKGKPRLTEDGEPIMEKKAHTSIKPRMKTVKILVPLIKEGVVQVREESVATRLGFKIHSFTIDAIDYEPKVKEQIDRQRDMEMKIQTKISEAETAKQDALTAEAEGKAQAAKAKWQQEVKKAQVITAAEQAQAKAALDLEAAKLEKQAAVERAKGEAESKRLVMEADGALDKKLKAWVEVQKAYAAQFGKQPHTPSVVMGGGKTSNGVALQDLLMLSAAKDLNLTFKPGK